VTIAHIVVETYRARN